MPTIPATGSLDRLGRLVHEDDAAAQLALSMSRLEDALADHGHTVGDLASLRVLTTDRAALDQVYDVLTERLDALGARPVTTIHEVAHLAVAGMLVALEADPHPHSSGLNDEQPTTKEER